jgi:hypothetical protein
LYRIFLLGVDLVVLAVDLVVYLEVLGVTDFLVLLGVDLVLGVVDSEVDLVVLGVGLVVDLAVLGADSEAVLGADSEAVLGADSAVDLTIVRVDLVACGNGLTCATCFFDLVAAFKSFDNFASSSIFFLYC